MTVQIRSYRITTNPQQQNRRTALFHNASRLLRTLGIREKANEPGSVAICAVTHGYVWVINK